MKLASISSAFLRSVFNWYFLAMNYHPFKTTAQSRFVSVQVEERTEDKASSRGHRGPETNTKEELPFQTAEQRPTQLSTFTSMLTYVHTSACTNKIMCIHSFPWQLTVDTHTGFLEINCPAREMTELRYTLPPHTYSTYLHTFAQSATCCHYLIAHTRVSC